MNEPPILENLRTYIKNWNSKTDGKPVNEDEFLDGFLYLINNLEDDRDIGFDGDGSYGGKQITLALNSYWTHDPLIYFEIVYCNDVIKVYSANNPGGYWLPEYVKLEPSDARFNEVKESLIKLLFRVFGLDKFTIKKSKPPELNLNSVKDASLLRFNNQKLGTITRIVPELEKGKWDFIVFYVCTKSGMESSLGVYANGVFFGKNSDYNVILK